MPPPKTIGFPRMRKEQGEKRVYLPEFIQYLTTLGAKVVIEEGYGSRSGYSFDDYRLGNEAVRLGSSDEAYQQDAVMVLRSLEPHEYEWIKPGTTLISMLHKNWLSRTCVLSCILPVATVVMDSRWQI